LLPDGLQLHRNPSRIFAREPVFESIGDQLICDQAARYDRYDLLERKPNPYNPTFQLNPMCHRT
jgi:hypothetical protein